MLEAKSGIRALTVLVVLALAPKSAAANDFSIAD
jgi:hypothetical protein